MFSNASKSRFSIVWVPITNMLPALDSVKLWGKGISFPPPPKAGMRANERFLRCMRISVRPGFEALFQI